VVKPVAPNASPTPSESPPAGRRLVLDLASRRFSLKGSNTGPRHHCVGSAYFCATIVLYLRYPHITNIEQKPPTAPKTHIMYRHFVLRCVAFVSAVATASMLASLPARALPPGPIVAAAPTATAQRPPACVITADEARFDFPLPHTTQRLASGEPIKIVALGSSSTYGAGASTSAATYPSRLAEELKKHFPGHEFTVLNRGVNGEEITDMLARLETAVIAERPDLVLWQVGTNSVLRDIALEPHVAELHEGLARLKATGADVVLIDPQYAPRVIAKPTCNGMVSLIAATAKAEHVGVFHRFELMRHWYQDEYLPFTAFVSQDGLHMNDWSYACLAKALGMAIAEAMTRPTTAAGPRVAQ
jgi:lysophospholipase L1-like esterase